MFIFQYNFCILNLCIKPFLQQGLFLLKIYYRADGETSGISYQDFWKHLFYRYQKKASLKKKTRNHSKEWQKHYIVLRRSSKKIIFSIFWCFSFQQDIILSPWKFKSPFEIIPSFWRKKKMLEVSKPSRPSNITRRDPPQLDLQALKIPHGWKLYMHKINSRWFSGRCLLHLFLKDFHNAARHFLWEKKQIMDSFFCKRDEMRKQQKPWFSHTGIEKEPRWCKKKKRFDFCWFSQLLVKKMSDGLCVGTVEFSAWELEDHRYAKLLEVNKSEWLVFETPATPTVMGWMILLRRCLLPSSKGWIGEGRIKTTCGSIVPWSTMTPLTASNSCVSNLTDFPFHIHTWTHWNLTKIYCAKKTRIPTQLYLSQWETSKIQNVPWKNTTKGRPQKGLLGIWCVWLFDLILLNGRTPGIWIHHVCSYAWYADKMRVLLFW